MNKTHLLKVLDFEPIVVQGYFDVAHSTRHIVDSFRHEGVRVVVYAFHTKSFQVGSEGDLGPFFTFLVVGDLIGEPRRYFRLNRMMLTFGVPFLLMFSLKTCLYFFPLILSAVSTTDLVSSISFAPTLVTH